MSYGPNMLDQFRRVADIVDKILRGRALEDEVRLLSRARGRKRKRKEQCGRSCHDAAPKLQTTHSLASISKVRPYVEIAGKN